MNGRVFSSPVAPRARRQCALYSVQPGGWPKPCRTGWWAQISTTRCAGFQPAGLVLPTDLVPQKSSRSLGIVKEQDHRPARPRKLARSSDFFPTDKKRQ